MTLRQAIIMCRSTQTRANMLVLNQRGLITNTIVFPLGYLLPLGYFQRSSVNLSCIGEPSKGIDILPYLDELLFLITGCEACRQLARMVEYDMRRAGLSINEEKSDGVPSQERIHLGFVVNLSEGLFKVPIHRWEALNASATSILSSKGLRVQARKLASLVGTVISMK